MSDEEAKVLETAKKLPLDERVTHTNWKVRVAAYEDIKVSCDKVFDDGDPVLSTYAPLLAKAVTDSNAAAMDRALEALAALLGKTNEQIASRICEKTSNNMVAKCLGGRPGTVMKAQDAFLAFVELEQAEKVTGSLIMGFNNKVPKVVVACLEVLLKVISSFGCKVVVPQPILKSLPPMFDSKDAKARDKVKEIVVELARWVGPELVRSMLFEKMRDAMKEDVEKLLQSLPPGRPRPERLTRKEHVKVQVEQEQDGGAGGEGEAAGVISNETEEGEQADAYDFAEPKDIIPELKKDFWAGLEAKKWLERKAALTMLKDLANYPRLINSDFGDVNRELKKIITKDSNVACVAEAILCCGNLAKGMRKDYSGTARSLCSVLLEKLKEKNAAVGKAVAEALSYMHKYCFTFVDVAEDLQGALGHQNPKVREECLKWMTECLARENKQSLSKVNATVLPAAAKCAEAAEPSLRELAMNFLVLWVIKVGSPSVLDKVTAKFDDGRKKKLEEMIEAARKMKGGRAAGSSGSSAPPPSAGRSVPALKEGPCTTGPPPAGKPASSRPIRSSSARPQTTASTTALASKASTGGKASMSTDNDDEQALASGTMSSDDATAKFTELFGEATVEALQDTLWKTRLEAMEAMLGQAEGLAADHCSVVVQGLQHLPGSDEKNFQVMGKVFEIIRVMAMSGPSFSKKDAYVAICMSVDKMADVKLRGPASEAMLACAEAVGPQFMCSMAYKKASNHKNPKVFSETITLFGVAIADFGLPLFNVKSLLDWMKEGLSHTNAGVRNAATNVLGVMHRFVGAALSDMIVNDVKPALMSSIQAEFEKNPQTSDFAPKRTSRADVQAKKQAGKAPTGKGRATDVAASAATFEMDDLLPRQDISDQLTGPLINNLTSSNWKDRKAALDEVESILTAAGNRIHPQLGDLIPALKQRMGDSNKNLTIQALQLLGKLAKAMGKSIDRQAHAVLAPALKNLADSKAMVRSAVVEMLEAWCSVAPVETIMEDVVDSVGSPKCSADGKKLVVEYLAAAVSANQAGNCLEKLVKVVGICCADKTSEVRQATDKLLAALMETYGIQELAQASQTLDGAHRKSFQEVLTKANGGQAVSAGPASQPSTSRPATASSVRSSTSSMRSSTMTVKPCSTPRPPSQGGKKATLPRSSMSTSTMLAPAPNDSGGALISLDTRKDDRTRKAKYKSNKFEIRPDELPTVNSELQPILSPGLHLSMFHKDFKKHCEAADIIRENVVNLYEEVISCVDLIIRWAVVRIVEGNTQTLLKILDLLKTVLDAMAHHEYKMSDYEAKSLLPGIVEKSGQNNDRLKNDFREIMKKCCQVYPSLKVLSFIKDGLDSKNNRTRTACAEEIGGMIDREGPRMYQSGKRSSELLATLAKLASDSNVRAAALGPLEVAYCFEGEAVWELLGKLNDQQQSIIQERFKAVDKDLTKKRLKAGYRSQELRGSDLGATHSEDLSPRCRETSTGASQLPMPGRSIPRTPQGGGSGLPNGRLTAAPRGHADEEQEKTRLNPLPEGALGVPPPSSVSDFVPLPGFVPPPSAVPFNLYTSPSPPHMIQGSDEDVVKHFKGMLIQLQGPDLEAAVEAMKVLCFHLMDTPGRVRNLALHHCVADNVDVLVSVLTDKTHSIFSSALNSVDGAAAPKSRACKYCLNTLMNLFQNPAFLQKLNSQTLEQLVSVLLLNLVEEKLQQMAEGDALLKALNVLMLKILENCNRTDTFGALLVLLVHPHPYLTSKDRTPDEVERSTHRWYDLVVKCLIKITKTLPKNIDTLDLRKFLFDIHTFFSSLGVEEIKKRGKVDDKPLRMVKTILHELCKLKGKAIYDFIGDIPQNIEPKPIILPYIDLNLETLVASNTKPGVAPVPSLTGQEPGSTPIRLLTQSSVTNGIGSRDVSGLSTSTSALPPPPSSRVSALHTAPVSSSTTDPQVMERAKELLSSILKRISTRKTTDDVMLDLHRFLKQHPGTDLNQFMVGASDTFKAYIQRGLQRFSAAGPAMVPSSTGSIHGAENQDRNHTTIESVHSTDEPPPPISRSSSGQRLGTANLTDLRDRMNKLQGDINAAHRSKSLGPDRTALQERSLQDLQERMKRIGRAD